MKSKQDLKSFFENGDRPNQEQFWELIESYFHKDEPITLEELSMLKANLATIDKTNDGTETIGNVDTKEQVNAKINFAINALKANAPETYDTLKEIADYIANDSNAEAALLQLINTKLDKPTMTNNYYGLWDDTNKKFVNGSISTDGSNIGIGITTPTQRLDVSGTIQGTKIQTAPIFDMVSDGYRRWYLSGSNTTMYLGIEYMDTPTDTQPLNSPIFESDTREPVIVFGRQINISRWTNGYIGIGVEHYYPSEKLDVWGNIKADSYKFKLPASITPKPNMLIPKTDGSGLMWYDNASVGRDLLTDVDVANKIDKPTQFSSYPSNNFKFIPVLDSTGDAKKLNLSTILDPKLDKPTMTNNYYGLWDDTNKKFINGSVYKNGSNTYISDKLYTPSGINSKDLSFTLQTNITPTPNTLVPKTDGSGLMWYNNSSVGAEMATYKSPSNSYVGRWNNGTFVNGAIQDDGSRIGIGVLPNDSTVSAQLNFKSTDRKVMNIPKTNFISSYINGQPSQNQQQGDVYNNGDNIFWLRSNSNIDRWKKLTGFDVDYIGKLPQDFNSLKTTYSDTFVNPNFDMLDKYGFANIWTSDYCYGQKLTERFTNITNADSRMYEGVLTNINLGIFAYNGAVQQYQDIKGNLFLRGLGYAYTEQDWKKVITDNNSKSTTLGSDTNYPSAKLAIDSTNKGFLLPRMTKLQRSVISSPVQGLVIFQTDSGNSGIRVYDGTNWLALQTTID